MKIYHTETQADYDALMVELEVKGIGTLGKRYWEVYENQTVVIVHALCRHSESTRTDTAYGSLEWALKNYLTAPQKYKAKTEDKMKFTKENVIKLTNEWIEHKIDSFQDLQNEIKKLDDAPEKVVVPKYVAEWIEWNKETGADLQIMFKAYRHYYDNINSYSEADGKKAVQWYVDNPYKFIQAYEDGYTIEPEQLYYIPLPDLETTDGLQQVLSKRENGTNYFACRPKEGLQQRYTKEELAQVPEIYKPYAKPIEEEEK